MPVIIKPRGKTDSTSDLVRRFKRAITAIDLVQQVKDRRYHVKPAQAANVVRNEKRRLKKKVRNLKRMKNVPPQVIERLTERLAS